MTDKPLAYKPFYERLPGGRMKLRFDHHMINSFNTCERLFFYKHFPNAAGMILRPKGTVGWTLKFGQWWSDVMSDFYEMMAAGTLTRNAAIVSAVKRWDEHGMELFKTLDPKKYEAFGGTSVQVEFNGVPYPLPQGAMTMITSYYDIRAEQDKRTWKIIATESGFGMKDEVWVGGTDKVDVYYVGKPDLVVLDENKRLVPVDHKTTAKIEPDFDAKWKPHAQTVGYIYAVGLLAKSLGFPNSVVDRCIINGAAREEPTDKPKNGGAKRPRFKRAYPNYTWEEIEEWRREVIVKAERLRECINTGVWPMRESSCHFNYGRPCEYRAIDSITPGARNVQIQASYTQSPPWVAYETE
jgi:GR25 family glycosyltransferase involved in LPS biosynthesis